MFIVMAEKYSFVHCVDFFYLQLVNQWTLIFGVKRQLDALREGFNSVLPLSNLTSFTYSEVRLVCCRLREVR